MPRVKIVRDNRTDSLKKITTRSKAKIKTETFSSAIVSKGNRTIPVPRAKFLTPISQQKQIRDVHVSTNKENKKKASAAVNNIIKDELAHHNKTVKESTKQKGIVIYMYDDSEDSDDDGKDSKDDSDSNSRDDYEPDTEDEEEYRSRSYFW